MRIKEQNDQIIQQLQSVKGVIPNKAALFADLPPMVFDASPSGWKGMYSGIMDSYSTTHQLYFKRLIDKAQAEREKKER